jgi:putative ABC transport system permease protein
VADVELRDGLDGTRQMYVPGEDKTRAILLDTVQGRSDAVATMRLSAIIGEPNVKPVNEGGGRFDQDGGGFDGGPGGPNMYCDENGCHPVTSVPEGAPRGQAIELSVTAMTGDVRQFRPFRPDAGRWLDFGAAPNLSPGIVLNREAAKGFGRYRVPAEMSVGGAPAHATPRIIGVIDDGSRAPAAYARVDEMLQWLPTRSEQNEGFEVLMSPNASGVEQTLKARLVASGVSRDDLHVNVIDSKEQMGAELSIVRWIFTGLASLVLLIGVAGILNVGLATVGERIEEFALRRAVGTPRTLLAGIVLAETLLTGLLTAMAAVGVAAAGLHVAEIFLAEREPALATIAFPWEAGVGGIIAGLAAGLLGGFVPAIRAARIPIATVMRA